MSKIATFWSTRCDFFSKFQNFKDMCEKVSRVFTDTCSYLEKKRKNFFRQVIFKKNQWGAGHLMPKKRKILRRQKFLAEISAGMAGNRPDENFGCTSPPYSRNFDLDH